MEMAHHFIDQTNAHVRSSMKLQVPLRPFPPRIVRCEQRAENARRFRSAQIGTGLWQPVDWRLSRAFQLKGIRHAQMAVARQIKPTPARVPGIIAPCAVK